MLTRLALIATAEAHPAARKLGLVADSAGLWFRARKLRSHWAEHERNCHAVIERAINTLADQRTVLVLGSGLLRDVPLARLAAAFETVLLVDAVHLWTSRRQAARFSNVRCLTLDVTGRLADFASISPSIHALQPLLTRSDMDLVISANLLSQLALGIEEVMERRNAPSADIAAMSHSVVGDHLAVLGQCPGRVCLLSDIKMEERGREGAILAHHDLLAGHILPPADATWEWPVAPFGVAESDRAYVHIAVGLSDFKGIAPG